MRRITAAVAAFVTVAVAATGVPDAGSIPEASPPDSGMLLYLNEGNRMRRVDIDTIGTDTLVQDVFIMSAADELGGDGGEDGTGEFPIRGRDSNGQICVFDDGRIVDGEDTRQQHPPAGWGVFDPAGTQIGKLTATYLTDGPEPHGCAIDAEGRLFTGEVGTQGFGRANGQLIQWFPPYDGFPGAPGAYPDTDDASTNFCKLATNLGTAGSLAVDTLGRVYVAASSGTRVERFSPPFPTGPDAAHGCSGTDATGAPVALASEVHREVVIRMDLFQFLRGMWTLSGLAFAPNGNLYVSAVANGRIAEYDLSGRFVRFIMKAPQFLFPSWYGSPQGLTVGPEGTIYYADLDLVWGWPPDPGPGPDGKVRRIRFDDDGDPMRPEVVLDGLAFPDGVAVLPGNLTEET